MNIVEKFNTLDPILKNLLKATLKEGEWGDTTMEFMINGKIESVDAYGFCTDGISNNTVPKGRKRSVAFKMLYNALGCDKSGIGEFVTHQSDFWDDGDDMLFIKSDDYEEVMKWAQEN